MLTTPFGSPASVRISPNSKVEPGVSSLGLTTHAPPATRANGSFWLMMTNGKFHDVIRATTPTGTRVVSPIIYGPSTWLQPPKKTRANPAAYRQRSIAPFDLSSDLGDRFAPSRTSARR